MDMRRDGESRGCREAGERDLVIKSSLHQRVYLGLLGHDRLKKRGGMGCGVPTTLASRKGHDGARPSAGGVQMGGASVRGDTTWRVLYNRYEETWRRVRTRHACVPLPRQEHGGAARRNSRRELGRRVATWGYWRDAVALAGAASTDNVPGGGLRCFFARIPGQKALPCHPSRKCQGGLTYALVRRSAADSPERLARRPVILVFAQKGISRAHHQKKAAHRGLVFLFSTKPPKAASFALLSAP
jgi:hypothetical protein